MYKRISILGIALFVCFNFSGCKKEIVTVSPKQPIATASPTKAPTPSPSSIPTQTPKSTTKPTPSPTKTPIATNHSLSNNRLSFGYTPNKENLPVSINKAIDNLLTKYKGLYIDKRNTKNIYLTMDEGYENGYTTQILDTLKQKNIQCAFFITKQYLDKNESLVKRMIDEGHIVGNHTVSHPSLPTLSNEKVIYEIKTLHDAVLDKFSYKMTYFRTPSGEFSENVLSIINNLGYQPVFWSFAYRDWETDKQKGADYALNTVLNGIHNGCILLLHAVSKDNTDALPNIIDQLKSKGYTFSSLNNLPS